MGHTQISPHFTFLYLFVFSRFAQILPQVVPTAQLLAPEPLL